MERTTRPEMGIAQKFIGIIIGVIEIVLVLRLIFKLLGANANNLFVNTLYNSTQFFVGIFEGIFKPVPLTGPEINGIFDPATIIAILVFGFVSSLLMKLLATSRSNIQ